MSFEEFVEIVSNIGASTAAPSDQDQEEQELRDAFRVSKINAILPSLVSFESTNRAVAGSSLPRLPSPNSDLRIGVHADRPINFSVRLGEAHARISNVTYFLRDPGNFWPDYRRFRVNFCSAARRNKRKRICSLSSFVFKRTDI